MGNIVSECVANTIMRRGRLRFVVCYMHTGSNVESCRTEIVEGG